MVDFNKAIKKIYTERDLTCVIYNGRGGGKTVLLATLLILLRGVYDFIYFFSPTYEQNKHYFNMFEQEDDFFTVYNIEKIDLFETLSNLYQKIIKLNSSEFKKDHKKILIIADDCFTEDNLTNFSKKTKGNSLLTIFNNGRHNSITLIILTQYVKYISKPMRDNTDIFITFNVGKKSQRVELESSLNPLNSTAEFLDILNSLEEFEPLMLIRRGGKKYFGGDIVINFDKVIDSKSWNKQYKKIRR